jgi:wobble nucleotide-excising tRNase
MEIKKINKINKFGIFSDFKWNKTIPDFKKHNIIYGWNYSGKTTIARVFACFENKKSHDDYQQAEFELEDNAGKKYSQNNLDQLKDVRVYNVDFVDRNLKWSQSGSEIEPIFMLGEENIELQEKLESLNEEIAKTKKIISEHVSKKLEIESALKKAYSTKAKSIKETLVLPDFEKRNLEPKVNLIKADYIQSLLPSDQYSTLFSTYRNQSEKEIILLVPPLSLKFETLQEQAKNLVEKQVSAQKVIEELKNNPQLNAWVKEGKILHEGKTVCQFCGNELPADLAERLNHHFSEEYTRLEEGINTLILELKSHQQNTLEFQSDLPDKAKFYPEMETEFETTKYNINTEVREYNKVLGTIIQQLEEKQQKPFSRGEYRNLNDPSNKLVNSISLLNQIIERHNTKTKNFAVDKDSAKEKLIMHFAAEFVNDQNLLVTESTLSELTRQIQENSALVKSNEAAAKKAESQLSDSVKGAEKVNEYIQQFFRHDGIYLEVTDSKKFRLVRNGVTAKNLSEGEKTAISLAYFIARLEDMETRLDETIVFIDDPVSSLDSNHIFNIYALIKTKLENCLQLFVSTHNMEFFNLMKEFLSDSGYEKKPELPCYLVEREWNATVYHSVIRDLPKVLKCYRSEYAYLFGILKEFKGNDEATLDQHRLLYLIPNVARRFLEGYLGLRYPDGQSWEKKLNKLISDQTQGNMIFKLVNEFSHNKTAVRSLKFPEPVECKEAVNTILDCLKQQDKEHYDALCRGI